MRSLLFLIALFAATTAAAHPGIGIVLDSRGNVYYTDLAQVWRVEPGGRTTVVVPHVHTHELYLDAQDNLYGENLWYEGDATKKWGHSIWRRSPDGKVETIIGPREGFRNEFSFVRDRAGNQYWNDNNTIVKRTPDGRSSTMTRVHFRDVRWMMVTPEGTVYFIDVGDLGRITPAGQVRTIARDLSDTRLLRPDISKRHMLMGLWSDRSGNICVADFAHGKVKRVAPDGRVTVIAESHLPWSVTGGVYAANGDLLLLEYSVTNAARVRRIRHR